MLFTPPQPLTGDAKKDATILYTHLFMMSEQLNAALQTLESNAANTSTSTVQAATEASSGAWGTTTVDPAISASYQALRSLIIKSADTVHAEMDALVETFASSYVAQSEYGSLVENLDTQITTTAEGILLDLDYSSRLDALDEASAGFSSYQAETEQYIKIGVVKYNDDGTTEAGVVVGKNLSTVTVDGRELVRSANMYSCFTAERLSFWKDEVEVAYFSNRTLYVTDVAVNDKITLGGKWQISHTNGFSIKWIGG